MKRGTVVALLVMALLVIKFGFGVLIPMAILGAVVFVHEYGHYVLMVRNGVTVTEFTVGFGPTLWEKQLKSGTFFRLKLILAGGYAKPLIGDVEGSIERASLWAKFKIYMAGMVFNTVTAFVVYLAMFYATRRAPGFAVDLVTAAGVPQGLLLPLACAFVLSFGIWLATPVLLIKLMSQGFASMFSNLSGPIGILQLGTAAAAGGAEPSAGAAALGMLSFFALINVALAGMNLLPLMQLDGGRIIYDVLRKIPKVGGALANGYALLSLVLLLGLIVLAVGGDLVKLFLPS